MRSCPTCNSDVNLPINYMRKDGLTTQSHIRKAYSLSICSNCGLVYYSTAPDKDEMETMYSSVYRNPGWETEQRTLEAWDDKIALWSQILKPYLEAPVRILDIGCSEGNWIHYLEGQGHTVVGVELNEYSLGLCKGKGLEVYRSIEEVTGEFDIIFMSGLFEHVYEPKKLLEQCRLLLQPSGIVYIQVPDLNCPNTIDIKNFFPVEHLQCYDANDLSNLLGVSGFQTVYYKDDVFNFGMCIIGKKGPVRPVDTSCSVIEKTQTLSNIFTAYENLLNKKQFNICTKFLRTLVGVKHDMGSSELCSFIVNNWGKLDYDKQNYIRRCI